MVMFTAPRPIGAPGTVRSLLRSTKSFATFRWTSIVIAENPPDGVAFWLPAATAGAGDSGAG